RPSALDAPRCRSAATDADHRQDNGSDEDRCQYGDPELLVHPRNVRLLTQCVKKPARTHDAKMPGMDELARRVGLRLERTLASQQFADGAFRNPTRAPPQPQGSALPRLGGEFLRQPQPGPPGP